MRRICLWSALWVYILFSAAETRAAERIVCEGEAVELIGGVVSRTAYGPPTFGENPRSDQREQYFALLSDVPLRRRFDDGKLDEGTTTRVQLFFNAKSGLIRERLKYAARLRTRITVAGSTMFAHTGHHHESLLLEVREVVCLQ